MSTETVISLNEVKIKVLEDQCPICWDDETAYFNLNDELLELVNQLTQSERMAFYAWQTDVISEVENILTTHASSLYKAKALLSELDEIKEEFNSNQFL